MSTRSPEEVAEVLIPGQRAAFQVGGVPLSTKISIVTPNIQLYVGMDWEKSAALVRRVEKLGYKAIILTVDTNVIGKREGDMRAQAIVAVGYSSYVYRQILKLHMI